MPDLSIALIFLGILLVIAGSMLIVLRRTERKHVEGGAFIMIGPIPIVIASSSRAAKVLIIAAVAVFIILLILLVV